MTKTNTVHSGQSDFIYILSSAAVGFVLTIVLLFVASALAATACLPEAIVSLIVTAVTYLSVGVSGFRSARGIGRSGLISGAVTGLIYVTVLYLIGSIVSGNFMVSSSSAVNALICVLSGAVGGLIGINLRHKKRR